MAKPKIESVIKQAGEKNIQALEQISSTIAKIPKPQVENIIMKTPYDPSTGQFAHVWVWLTSQYDKPLISSKTNRSELMNMAPVWQWEHWPIWKWVKGADAEQLLIMKKWGEVQGAYTYKWDPVDLIWGGYNKTKKTGIWLAKIVEKHPEVIGKIQKIINTLPEAKRTNKEILLDDWESVVVIKLTWKDKRKSWLMTAYDR